MGKAGSLMKRKREINSTLIELILGNVIYGIIITIPTLIFMHNRVKMAALLWFGVLISVAMVVHMYTEIEKSLYMGEHGALKHTRVTTALRYVVVAGVLCLTAFFVKEDVIVTLVGSMALKVSAYIQPFTHRFLNKFYRKGR